jgi:hypothetical protein
MIFHRREDALKVTPSSKFIFSFSHNEELISWKRFRTTRLIQGLAWANCCWTCPSSSSICPVYRVRHFGHRLSVKISSVIAWFQLFTTFLVFRCDQTFSSLLFGFLLIDNWIAVTTASVNIILGSRSNTLHTWTFSCSTIHSIKFCIFLLPCIEFPLFKRCNTY